MLRTLCADFCGLSLGMLAQFNLQMCTMRNTEKMQLCDIVNILLIPYLMYKPCLIVNVHGCNSSWSKKWILN